DRVQAVLREGQSNRTSKNSGVRPVRTRSAWTIVSTQTQSSAGISSPFTSTWYLTLAFKNDESPKCSSASSTYQSRPGVGHALKRESPATTIKPYRRYSPGLLQAISSRLMRPKHESEGQQAMCGYSPTHMKWSTYILNR